MLSVYEQTQLLWGRGNLYPFSHWRKWLVINAARQNLPMENAVLTKNICAEMYLFHQIFNGKTEPFHL